MTEKRFAVVVCHSGATPLGESITREHAFFSMLTVHESGKFPDDLEVNETCVRRAATADGMRDEYQRGKRKSVPILYNVARVS